MQHLKTEMEEEKFQKKFIFDVVKSVADIE